MNVLSITRSIRILQSDWSTAVVFWANTITRARKSTSGVFYSNSPVQIPRTHSFTFDRH